MSVEDLKNGAQAPAVKFDSNKPDFSLVPRALAQYAAEGYVFYTPACELADVYKLNEVEQAIHYLAGSVLDSLYRWNESASDSLAAQRMLLAEAAASLGTLCDLRKHGAIDRWQKMPYDNNVANTPLALFEAAARAYMFGERKYAAFNYRNGRGIEVRRLLRATVGHILTRLDGDVTDSESGLDHYDHAVAAFGMLLDTVERVQAGELPRATDNRWKAVQP